jgi:hypothetical protein
MSGCTWAISGISWKPIPRALYILTEAGVGYRLRDDESA